MSSSNNAAGRTAPADETASPAAKKVRSVAPDLVVSVGSGDSAKKFECYKFVLSWASDVLDAMLSSGMKEGCLAEIEFPDKDPEEWELFYEFIHPRKIGKVKCDAIINRKNVLTLLPWFHEFQMDDHVKECDKCLAREWDACDWKSICEKERTTDENEAEHQTRLARRKITFGEALGMIQLANRYGLGSTEDTVVKGVTFLMGKLVHTSDLFDLPAVKLLLQMVFPLELDNAGLRMKGGEGCKSLWPSFEGILSPHMACLSQEAVHDHATFSLLVHSFMGIEKEQEKVKSATKIIKTMIQEYPRRIYNEGTQRRSLDSGTAINEYGKKCFMKVVRSHYHNEKKEFESLGIRPPTSYDTSNPAMSVFDNLF